MAKKTLSLSWTILASVLVWACELADCGNSRSASRRPLVNVVYEFPIPTWVENIAVRPNGMILANLLSSPDLYQIDPIRRSAKLVHRFPDANGLLGISEVEADTFYLIAAGNWDHNTLNVTAHRFAIWRVEYTDSGPDTTAIISKAGDLNEGVFLNGITKLGSDSCPSLLVADSRAGVVFRFDTLTGEFSVVLDDPLLKPTSRLAGLGVNGLKMDHGSGYLYFSNSAQAILGRVAINPDGTARGKYEVLTTNAAIDDFVLNPQGGALLCQNIVNELAAVGPRYGPETVLVDSNNDTVLLGPTAASFGRGRGDKRSVYVSTTGGLQQWADKDWKVGGRIERIDFGFDV